MATEKLNDAPILDQVGGDLDKFLMLIVWKLCRDKAVKISVDDMKAFERHFGVAGGVLFIHGLPDGVEFSVVSRDAAQLISEHNASLSGKGSH